MTQTSTGRLVYNSIMGGPSAYRTNTSQHFDPDFGTKIIRAGKIYRVNVAPFDKRRKPWTFYLLFPKIEADEFEEPMEKTQAIVEEILEAGDSYEIMEVDNDDAGNFNASVPLLSFDPQDEEKFIWLTPPKACRH